MLRPDPVKEKYLGGFTLLAAKPGTCPECATKHKPELPHNQQSLFYQYRFYGEHGRWPKWEDALAHCDDKMYGFWRQELGKKGVAVAEREKSLNGPPLPRGVPAES